MSAPALSSETIHCSCVAIQQRAVLIGGRPGSGKSDLALRLIDRGARLVSDDYTHVRRIDGRILASAPPKIKGKIEMRGVGLVELPPLDEAPVALFVDLDRAPERMPPDGEIRVVAGLPIPLVALAAHEDSAPIKVEMALRLFGLPE